MVHIPIFYWSDSANVLFWIKRNENWAPFVYNRVQEILSISKPEDWNYVPGSCNPADLPSRGCSVEQLVKSRWWEGPPWLKELPKFWPKATVDPDYEVVDSERKRTVIAATNVSSPKPEESPDENLIVTEKRKSAVLTLAVANSCEFMQYARISKFSRFVNILCWVKRFIVKLKDKSRLFSSEFSAEEREDAEKLLWSRIQLENFGDVTDSVKGLMIMRDQDGLLRVKTKIIDRDDEYSFRYPILLPSKHHVVNCLIQEYHLKNCHAGLQTIGSILREKYWIISAKRNIRSQLSKCIKCRRFTAKPYCTQPIHLPMDRVRDSKVFEVVGIDLCGPLYLKRKTKVWIVLFTCAVYRAVHLEMVTNLSTEGFIQALRRFISRRGRPSTIYSDNGTNFRGTNNLLKSLDWNRIVSCEELSPINWKFIPPTAAWWGGWWERLIRCVKDLLLRTLGGSHLNFEEMLTILCDVEATVNKRPLTYLSEEPDKLIPLTPASFLQDIQEIGVPDLDYISAKKIQVRAKHCQNIREQLRQKFRKEYLAELIQKATSKGHSVKKGDVVLIELSHQKRQLWPIGKIIKIFPSRDKCTRVAEVKTSNGVIVRPVRKLYPLEIPDYEDPVIQTVSKVTTRSGRTIKKPNPD